MLRNLKYKVDSNESIRKLRRYIDGHISYRKLFIILLLVTIILLYFGPIIIGYFTRGEQTLKDPLARCLDDRLTPFYMKNIEFNANIRHNPVQTTREDLFVPYVGNGFMGLDITPNANIYIKYGRYLSQPVLFHPIISVTHRSNFQSNEAYVVDYLSGFVHRFQCFDIGFYVSYEYYAHRFIPQVFVQEIKITNTMTQMIDVDLTGSMSSNWLKAERESIKLQHGSTIAEYEVTTGIVEPNRVKDEIIVVTIVARQIPKSVTLRKRGVTKLEFLLTINYSEPISRDKYSKTRLEVEKGAIDSMQKALQMAEHNNEEHRLYSFKRLHMQIWKNLWLTGFEISSSLAEDSINGDRINATIYAVLSQVRSFESEDGILPSQRLDIDKILNNVEGCYDTRHHTLQAENLWRNMKTIDELNTLVSSWLLTLEKQGCHNLIKAGASGVVQAMVLSFGGFRFSNQHLEFNIHPKYLHRDYFFRRIRYGNMTHVNVSVAVTTDNKAVMYVALDRTDGQYYACDAGCLDDAVKLGPEKTMFPVKLTEPLTAILYIASDREHILELHHAIHVKEVAEAPAHEHHIIALHKHGHHLGGLPTLFWISICVIIIVFHVFLCKLIVKEYCEPPDKFRYRYVKPYMALGFFLSSYLTTLSI